MGPCGCGRGVLRSRRWSVRDVCNVLNVCNVLAVKSQWTGSRPNHVRAGKKCFMCGVIPATTWCYRFMAWAGDTFGTTDDGFIQVFSRGVTSVISNRRRAQDNSLRIGHVSTGSVWRSALALFEYRTLQIQRLRTDQCRVQDPCHFLPGQCKLPAERGWLRRGSA